MLQRMSSLNHDNRWWKFSLLISMIPKWNGNRILFYFQLIEIIENIMFISFIKISNVSCSTSPLKKLEFASQVLLTALFSSYLILWLNHLKQILVTLLKMSLQYAQIRNRQLCPGRRCWAAYKLQDTNIWKKYTNETCMDLVSLSSLVSFLYATVLLYGWILCQGTIASWIVATRSENWTVFMPSIKSSMQSTLWNVSYLHKVKCKRCYLIKLVLLCKMSANEWTEDRTAILPIIKH